MTIASGLASGSFWMPPRASTSAGDVDGLFYFVYGITVFFFLLVLTLLVVFVWRYRHREGREHDVSAGHSTALEITWTVIPTVIVIIIFLYGFRGFLRMAVIPPNPYEIYVTGRTWSWSFQYPNGYVDSELHVPVDTPVRLILQSEDVIHSLYIPQFRLKKDVVPGRYNKFWFEATEKGTFDIYCAEYCGTNHSQMLSKVIVHDPLDFARWLEQAGNWEGRMSPTAAGRMLMERRGCVQCHTTDGATLIGPSLRDMFGSMVRLSTGQQVRADEDYVRESIVSPNAKIVAGFQPVMPPFSNIKDRDMTAIIAYLKSISSNYSGPPATQPATRPAE